MLSATAGFAPRDPFSLPEPRRDFLAGIEDGVAGMCIGILISPGFAAPADDDALNALESAWKILQSLGATVVQANIALPDASVSFTKIWGAALARQVATIAPEKHALLDHGLTGLAAKFSTATALDMLEAEAQRVQAAHAMATAGFDALICPCVPQTAPLAGEPVDDPVTGLLQHWAPWTLLFNLTRQPAISLPMGVNAAGLPVAVQIAAPLYRDDVVLKIARAVEKAV